MASERTRAPGRAKRWNPDYQRLAKDLRRRILSGELKPGTKLQSTKDLAALWDSNAFTVHTALSRLVKEGLIERRHGSGTFVADLEDRFTCAGLYYSEDVWLGTESAYYRNLHAALNARFRRMRKKTNVFIDTRDEKKQATLLPSLAEAIANREIQCLIAPVTKGICFPALNRLPMPVAFVYGPTPNRIIKDYGQFVRTSLERLAQQGCRSVGLISNAATPEIADGNVENVYAIFRQEAQASSLQTCEQWVCQPQTHVYEIAKYGYFAFQKLWNLPQKPDGLIVANDFAATGVITSILESGVRVPDELKVVFFRNAHMSCLCPFPATWGVSDEALAADALIKLIDQQFKGEKISPISIPFQFEETSGVAP